MARKIFLHIYQSLLDHYGPQKWWPAESPLEMVVGAILTQNTNWNNVAVAIDRLKKADILSISSLCSISHAELASLVRPAGYYNLKAKRLKNLMRMIADEFDSNLQLLLDEDPAYGRRKLLEVNGVGEETADSILLYAGGHPVFVVDAYTHRVFSRHLLLEEESSYQDIQEIFMTSLPSDASLFNEYHALIVRVAKEYCKKKAPLCELCPLEGM